jgi:cation:H+ antiporter
MMVFSIALYFFLKNDLILTRLEGGILLTALVVFIYAMIAKAKKEKSPVIEDVDDALMETSYSKIFIWLTIGAAALYFGSEFLVNGAKDIATQLGISERVIGATVIAIGTSVPELAASIIAALKGEKAISLGNLIGSNIFNIGSVLGLTAIITPIHVANKAILTSDVFWMLAVAGVLIPLVFIPKKFEISRVKGLVLFVAYIVFIYLAFASDSIS